MILPLTSLWYLLAHVIDDSIALDKSRTKINYREYPLEFGLFNFVPPSNYIICEVHREPLSPRPP